MEHRIDRAIEKLEARERGIPLDEKVIENRDYTKLVSIIETLKKFRHNLTQMDKLLTDLGV